MSTQVDDDDDINHDDDITMLLFSSSTMFQTGMKTFWIGTGIRFGETQTTKKSEIFQGVRI